MSPLTPDHLSSVCRRTSHNFIKMTIKDVFEGQTGIRSLIDYSCKHSIDWKNPLLLFFVIKVTSRTPCSHVTFVIWFHITSVSDGNNGDVRWLCDLWRVWRFRFKSVHLRSVRHIIFTQLNLQPKIKADRWRNGLFFFVLFVRPDTPTQIISTFCDSWCSYCGITQLCTNITQYQCSSDLNAADRKSTGGI